jgi:L-ribulokinase
VEVATGVANYPSGRAGIILDERNPNLARQHPQDHLVSMEAAVAQAVVAAGPSVACDVVGIGVDATGSTPGPIDETGTPLALRAEFRTNPNAMFWLWRDHTAHAEAAEITHAVPPQFLERCGGAYSAEWFWSKMLHCTRVDAAVAAAAHSWVEMSDWLPAVLTGVRHASEIPRNRCASGHKGLFCEDLGGLPPAASLDRLDRRLGDMRRSGRLYEKTVTAGTSIGGLCAEWAAKFGLRSGIPVSAGLIDAHAGAVGSGVAEGRFVKIVGTSTCDIAVTPLPSADQPFPRIPGICGIVNGSVVPGMLGLEAGQSAVGDIFNWYVNTLRPGGGASFEDLSARAALIGPGESGLLALDWWNGNRTVLIDQCLTGLIVG